MGSTLLIAFSIVLVIEGLGPMLFPKRWKSYIYQIATQPSEQLRTIGGVMVIVGAISLFFLVGK
ncbi:DUF2065 domain-containing protein [Aliiglaciecola sp. 3_MG-2023]|uniref:DUF2065 domain-containing protein n=1 Tax=Aliiglaciecola sp. 3_MG-2023 TaxID=3062644 RepID=UPI0026E22DE6|nr:DUF2065 domain-containing protein [Aliiglaciecola sp. 3_MG-2023]MDO6692293.1 DUF2065 domain-containing protein [Aliiglaciecola sp. 3_MG-2023]